MPLIQKFLMIGQIEISWKKMLKKCTKNLNFKISNVKIKLKRYSNNQKTSENEKILKIEDLEKLKVKREK